MRRSRMLLVFAVLVIIVPPIIIKISIWTKYKNQDWVFHSSKVKLDMNTVDQIDLNGVKTFRYQYHPDSAYLEYNRLFEADYIKSIHQMKLSIQANDSAMNNRPVLPPSPGMLSLLTGSGIMPVYYPDIFTSGTEDIVFHGPVCPPIHASNTTFYIESVAPNASFNFDLDFSRFYWENYSKGSDGKFNRKSTTPWYMDTLTLKLNQSTYYLTNNLHFKQVNIKAVKKTDIDFDENYYEGANIEVDSTVIVRAPVSIWNKLKLTMSTQ